NKGVKHSLNKVAEDNKVVLLSFTVYGAEASPAYNILLNKVYDNYSKSGLEIYQVSLDEDEYLWKQSAKNLPWITVYNSPADGVQALNNYNIQVLPTTYLIVNGELVERIADPAQINQIVAKYM
ncbi:MAG: thioredoxin family protein, partial [Paramuribaculum sp.]|nr:thioredoxin family protein [Paramuribaculum sp.]